MLQSADRSVGCLLFPGFSSNKRSKGLHRVRSLHTADPTIFYILFCSFFPSSYYFFSCFSSYHLFLFYTSFHSYVFLSFLDFSIITVIMNMIICNALPIYFFLSAACYFLGKELFHKIL